MNNQLSRGRLIGRVLVCLAVVVFAAPAFADVISYTTQVGDDVTFGDIREYSATDPTPLFGEPTVSLNSLVFYPQTLPFEAHSALAAPPVDLTDGTLSMCIYSSSQFGIGTITVWEQGDYTLMGSGTKATQAMVGAALFVAITQVDGQAITPIVFHQQMTFSPKADGQFNLVDNPGVAVNWEGIATLDINGALMAAEIDGKATKVVLALDNALVATSEAGSESLIKKKLFGIDVEPDDAPAVPEPSSVVLLLCGFCALLIRRLR